jgi:hypothetical protein
MTAIVTPEIAEQAWRRVGRLDHREVVKLQKRSGKFQPELVGFVLGFIDDLSPEGMGIALYAMLVIFEMFQRAAPTGFTKVNERAILQLWQESRRIGDALLASEFDSGLMSEFVIGSPEPTAIRYVVEALVDAQEESGNLPAEEVAQVLAIHRTVIHSLHAVARQHPLPSG